MKAAAALAFAVATAAVAVPAVSAAKAPPTKKVKVGDDYFSPGKFTVKKNTTVVWKWLSSNGDTHDVKLVKKPKEAKKFHSPLATSGYTYKHKLTVKGKYTVICTIHPSTMRMTITVK